MHGCDHDFKLKEVSHGVITLVYSYYENGGMLDRHLMEWASYAPRVKSQVRAIVVDDGSPKDPAADHRRDVGFPVQFYRIKQNLVWNTAGARNLGMHVATDGWCLLTDIDHLLQAGDAERLVWTMMGSRQGQMSGFYLVPARRWPDGRAHRPHSNSYILTRDLYWRVGGCDEDWTGWWGAGEPVFRIAIERLAERIDMLDIYLTCFGPADIADAATMEWGRSESRYSYLNNPALLAKVARAPYRPENPLRFDWEKIEGNVIF